MSINTSASLLAVHGLLKKLPITGDVFVFRVKVCRTRCSSKHLPGPEHRTLRSVLCRKHNMKRAVLLSAVRAA